MNVAGENAIGVVENGFCLICENYLSLCSAFSDYIAVVFNIVNTGKFVDVAAEKLTVFFKAEDIAVGVNALIVKLVIGEQGVADLVRRV